MSSGERSVDSCGKCVMKWKSVQTVGLLEFSEECDGEIRIKVGAVVRELTGVAAKKAYYNHYKNDRAARYGMVLEEDGM